MSTAAFDAQPPPSLLGPTVRRASVVGRFFLVYGSAISAVLGAALGFSGGSAFGSSFPLFLPIFGVVGSMGALVVFTNDRQKGVLEYLMAYGFSPRRLFGDVLVASLVLVSVILTVALSVGLGVYLVRGHSITLALALELGVYSVPMTYVSAAFAATVGMYWTSLSSPRLGMNSPVGLVPFIGILPALGTLGVIVALEIEGAASATSLLIVAGGAIGLIAATVAVLLSMAGRLLRRERLLSQA